MTPATQTKIIRDAIEPVLEKWCILHDLHFGDEERHLEMRADFIAAIKTLQPPSMPTDEETERKVTLIDDMITHVEKVINAPGSVDYGRKKWEIAIKYLVKVKVEKGWDIQVLWAFLQSEEIMFEKNKLSYGSLMADPDKMLKVWMPRAHAAAVEGEPTNQDTLSILKSRIAAAEAAQCPV